MTFERRDFLKIGSAGLAAGLVSRDRTKKRASEVRV
jgi:hypothetical protein